MIIPIRCFTCGKLIGDKWEKYRELKREGKSPSEIFDELGIKRFCCKRMLISHVNLIDDVLAYNRYQ
ncbi:MAG: DNA-directed RNA polymerase subunit N [Promethearchaeota archaeon]